MMNLVDYGSDSSDNEDVEGSGNNTVSNGRTNDVSAQPSIISKLPTVSGTAPKKGSQEEGELEDFLKSRKQWEKELAEEAKSEKAKPKKKGNALGGFGSLLNKPLIDEREDVQEIADKTAQPVLSEHRYTSTGSSLLNLLPQPNKKTVKPATKSNLLPSTLTPRQTSQPTKKPIEKPVQKPEPQSDEEDDGPADFFGFNSANVEMPVFKEPISQFVPPKPRVFDDAPMPGPSRPPVTDNFSDDEEGAGPAKKVKLISDEKAQNMIYKAEVSPWGLSDNIAREAVMNIREVNVDRELGPNVRETLLRNLNNKSMAQASAISLPNVKKDAQGKLSKQKHQITYLAQAAVAREEQLQEQWADNKAKRMSTAKRYGFR